MKKLSSSNELRLFCSFGCISGNWNTINLLGGRNMSERLEDIKKELELVWSEWLINRVEEWEKINKKLIESTTVVANENHRYKLALEFYANKKNYDIRHLSENKHEIPVFKDYGERARKALEGEE